MSKVLLRQATIGCQTVITPTRKYNAVTTLTLVDCIAGHTGPETKNEMRPKMCHTCLCLSYHTFFAFRFLGFHVVKASLIELSSSFDS